MFEYDENEANAILTLMSMKSRRSVGSKDSKIYKNKTKKQVRFLAAVYAITKYPSRDTRIKMATLINISPRKIQIWFQNRRQAQKDESYLDRANRENVIENNVENVCETVSEKTGESVEACNVSVQGAGKDRTQHIKSNEILQLYLDC